MQSSIECPLGFAQGRLCQVAAATAPAGHLNSWLFVPSQAATPEILDFARHDKLSEGWLIRGWDGI